LPEYKRILVIRFSSLGDILLTIPLLKVLRRKFPNAVIDYCTKSEYKDLIKLNPNINSIIAADNDLDFRKLKLLKKELTGNLYNLVIDLHNNLRTFYLKLFLGFTSKIIVFRKYSVKKFLLVNFKINLIKSLPSISVRYIETLKKITELKESDLSYQPEIFTNNETKTNLIKILGENGIPELKNTICFIPGSKHFTKTWPPEYYAELINMFDENSKIILAGTDKDKVNIDFIKSKTRENVSDLCGKLSLTELTELMKQCRLVICGDTGPMHIADSLNIPLIAIMGSSVREFGFYPQSQSSTVIENTGLKCRPCSHIGKEKCPKGHFKCMKEIKPEAVYYLVKEKLSSNL
jgi:lipopolysaccharide heptosyltransferase II